MTADLRYVVAPDVAWLDAEDVGDERPAAYVTRLPGGPPMVLEGPAWAIWCGVATGGTLAEITDEVAALTGEEAATVAGEVALFLESLVEGGLVSRSPSEQPS